MGILGSEWAHTPIDEQSRVGSARRRVMDLCRGQGLTEEDTERAGIVCTELATNVLKHGGGGSILMALAPAGKGVDILALDRGPGIADFGRMLQDQCSTTGTLGCGLGAVQRLSSMIDIYTRPARGTALLARVLERRRGLELPQPADAPWQVEGVMVRKTDTSVCGDGWYAEADGRRLMLMVVDGLGHGPAASEAARAAEEAVRKETNEQPEAWVKAIHAATVPTRGAVALVVRVTPEDRRIIGAGVGNISGRVVAPGQASRLVSHPGILGRAVRHLHPDVHDWPAQALLILHSDGVSQRWSLDQYPGLAIRHPLLIAAVLLRDHGGGTDDATVVVARERRRS